jgi:signal transduction histidine kinase
VADSLQAIKTASKDGLRELRAILNVLRQADDADPTQPAPGTAQLETLITGASRAGLDTTLTVTGEPVPLPAAVDLAAYRIVQESLTNASRYGAGSARVELSFGERGLELTVTNPVAPGAVDAPEGNGLTGMRERALLAGGSLEARRDDDTFRVHARLPAR